jgi:hypothetical protein
LIVTDAERLDDFPFDQVQQQSLAWKGRSLIRIVAALPRATLARVCARIAGLRSGLEVERERRRSATNRLNTVCRVLAEGAGGRVEVDYRLVEGNARQVALESARRLAPALLVVDELAADDCREAFLGRRSRATVPLTAPCSVLLLASGVPHRAVRVHSSARVGAALTLPRSRP